MFAVAFVLLIGCNNTKSDAQKAASLTNKSNQLARKLEFEKAETYYIKSRKIMNKYRDSNKEESFFQYYKHFRDQQYMEIRK